MDDVSDHAPHAEVVAGVDLYHGVVFVGRDQTQAAVTPGYILDGVFAVELTEGHLVVKRFAVAFVYNQDVSRGDAGLNHRLAAHADEIGGLGVGAKHTPHVHLACLFVAIERHGETGSHFDVKERQAQRRQSVGFDHSAHPVWTAALGLCRFILGPHDAVGDKPCFVGLAVDIPGQVGVGPEGKQAALTLRSAGPFTPPAMGAFGS